MKVFSQCTLIWQENTFILAGKRCAEIIFEQAGGAHNQRLFTDLNQHRLQLIQNIRWEGAFTKLLLNGRIFGAHLGFRLVFLVVPNEQIIDCHEGVELVGTDVKRLRH